MPTVEIASANSKGLNLNQNDFEVAIIEEKKLRSHRGLFYDFLKKQKGAIVHIGNPYMKDDNEGGFFAGGIIDWSFDPCEYIIIPECDPDDPTYNRGANQQFQFQFYDEYKPDIDKLLTAALDGSPIKRVYFLTDYQFGPEKESFEVIYTISDFWELHDSAGLRLNTLYEIYGR